MAVQRDSDRLAAAKTDEIAEEALDESSLTGVPLERRLRDKRTIISFVVAFAILFFAFSRINVDPGEVIAHIRQANLALYVAAFLVYYLSFPLRAWRWRLLLSNAGYRRSGDQGFPGLGGLGKIIFLSWFANCLVPAKLGDAYRGYRLKRDCGVSFSRTMGTVLAERILDMLVLFAMMALAAFGLFGPYLPGAVEYLFIAGIALVAIIIGLLVVMKHFGRQVENRLPRRLRGFYTRFEEGTLQSFGNVPLLSLLTVAVWVSEAARLWLIVGSLGLPQVGFMAVVFISLAASLLTTLPVTPAGLGLVESGIVAILLFLNSLGTIEGLSQSAASSVAILDRTISYWSIVVLGTLAYTLTRKR